MKKLTVAFLSAISVLSMMAACNKNDGGNAVAPGSYATTPQACNVTNNPYQQQQQFQQPAYNNSGLNYWYYNGFNNTYGGNYNQQNYNVPYQNTYYCNNNQYANFNNGSANWYNGQWYWPTQWQASQTNCGCPMGYISVYAAQYGVACAPATYAQSYNVVYYSVNWYWGAAQNTYQLNTPQAQYVGPASSCQNSVQGCDTRMNNCPSGSYCQAAGGGSSIGLCVH